MTDRQKLLQIITGNPALVSRLLVCADGNNAPEIVSSSDSAYTHFAPLLAGQDREHFAVMALGRRHQVLGCEVLTIGNDGFCIVDPRQVYSWALRQGKQGASAVIVAHNHPSGNPRPSHQDYDVTAKLVAAGALLGVPVLDHLIVAADGYASMADEGYAFK